MIVCNVGLVIFIQKQLCPKLFYVLHCSVCHRCQKVCQHQITRITRRFVTHWIDMIINCTCKLYQTVNVAIITGKVMTSTHAWRPVELKEFDTDYILHWVKTITRIFTTYSADCDDKVGIMTPLGFQWCHKQRHRMLVIYLHNDVVRANFSSSEDFHMLLNTSRSRQNGRHFPDSISKCIFLNENLWISIKISPSRSLTLTVQASIF